MKRIAYEHRDIEDVLRYLGKCPHDDVARFVAVLSRGGIEVDVKMPEPQVAVPAAPPADPTA